MRTSSALLFLLAALPLVACDESTAQPGEKGGACRITLDGPCDEGLVCREGACRSPIESDGGLPALDVDFTLQKRALKADGEDNLIAQVQVLDRETGEPWVGDLRVWTFPRGGTLLPQRLELKDDGKAAMRLTACDGDKPRCPASTRLRVAAVDAPLDMVGESEDILLVGGGRYGRDVDGGVAPEPTTDAGPMQPMMPTSNECRGSDNRIELRGGPIAHALAGETAILVEASTAFATTAEPDDVTIEGTPSGGAAPPITVRFTTARLEQELMQQAYEQATDPGAADPGVAGLEVRVSGESCANAVGQFRVRFVEFDDQGLVRFGAEFAYACGDRFDASAALQGCVGYTRPE